MMSVLARLVPLLLLVAAMPGQAEDTCPECGEDPECPECDQSASEPETNSSAEPQSQSSGQGPCQLVDYSLSSPTSVVVDPDRCFVPYLVGLVP